jgi:hypothetical protein
MPGMSFCQKPDGRGNGHSRDRDIHACRTPDGSVAVYLEAAAVITILVLPGQVLELRTRESTSGAIRALLDLTPKTARAIRDDDNSTASISMTACGCNPARRSRSTARCWKAAARSTGRG